MQATDETMMMWGIGLAMALIALIVSIMLIRRRKYFSSPAYVQNRQRIISFSKEFCRCRSVISEITDSARKELVELGGPAAEFFANRLYRLPNDVTAALAEYAGLDDGIRKHFEEVNFVNRFSSRFQELMDSCRYVSYKEVKSLTDDAEAFYNVLKERTDILFDETRKGLGVFPTAEELRKDHNQQVVKRELQRCDPFFGSVAKYSLDNQQRECCVIDDDAGLVIAGAGSGKTSVIMAKVAYLVKECGVDPSKILLISFTNKAADEMTDRIKKCLLDNEVKAKTFHKFGLDIIRTFVGERYDIVEESYLQRLIHKMMTGTDDVVPGGYDMVVKYFAYYFNPDQIGKKEDSLGEKIEREKTLNFESLKSMAGAYVADPEGGRITLAGERVKSLEEVMIANFLFLNGIEYKYESKYSKEYDDDGKHRTYRPDFYLPDFDVYLEHYGVDKNGNPPSYFPAVEKRKYIAGMKWKRQLHSNHGNKYIESYSWWNRENILFTKLTNELQSVGVVFRPLDAQEVWRMLCQKSKHQLSEFEKLIASFISLYKSNGYDEEQFNTLLALEAGSTHDTERQRAFLKIAQEVFVKYQESLAADNAYDFNDMICKATEIVKGLAPASLPYSHIIVDEYQDASIGRMRLLDAVVQNSNAHLFCVGDDWQSIFRFAGSDINLFTRFADYFGQASVIMRIENTYRNSQELIDVMGRFVMKNPWQVRKELRSNLHYKVPIRPILYKETDVNEYNAALTKALDMIAVEVKGKATNVLLLGRTKYDEEELAKNPDMKKSTSGRYHVPIHPELSCQFLTVHKSKGLEADYVILLNAKNTLLGFPNRIADDPILQIVLSSPEPYDFAEERRLFYVALTRTRNAVFILTPQIGWSPFMRDLFDSGIKPILLDLTAGPSNEVHCPKCETGVLVNRTSAYGMFTSCSNFPICDYRVPFEVSEDSKRCPLCGGFLLKRYNSTDGSAFWGCSNYPYCTHTEEIGGGRYGGRSRHRYRKSGYGRGYRYH